MRDPHVEALHYSVAAEGTTEYLDPEPLAIDHALGSFHITGSSLTVEPSEHFADQDEAIAAVDPFLRAWEVATDLDQGLGTIRFKFERASIIDRDPPPPGSPVTVALRGIASSVAFGNVTIKVSRNIYPPPPLAFRLTPEVEMAFRRWRAYRAGAEPLPAMAYFVLTMIENLAGTRRDAAKALSVDFGILKRVGDLASTRGDAMSARKVVKGSSPLQDLTAPEKEWMELAVRRLVLRLGEHASGAKLMPFTMKDLPAP